MSFVIIRMGEIVGSRIQPLFILMILKFMYFLVLIILKIFLATKFQEWKYQLQKEIQVIGL